MSALVYDEFTEVQKLYQQESAMREEAETLASEVSLSGLNQSYHIDNDNSAVDFLHNKLLGSREICLL